MAGYILREDQPNIVLPAQQADRLIGRGDGDAALLYLCLLRADRGVTAQELQRKLKWSQLRLHAAETALQELGLIDRPPEKTLPEPAQERPVYTADDLTDLLTGDAGFRMLVPQTEEKLGKRLKTADLQILAGLYDDLGLPADVIYLLVCSTLADAVKREHDLGIVGEAKAEVERSGSQKALLVIGACTWLAYDIMRQSRGIEA